MVWKGLRCPYFDDPIPSVKWKLLNLNKLKQNNPKKLMKEANRLKEIFE
jgi:hypothetical protein